MALIEINWTPSEKEARSFGVLWLPAFVATVGALVLLKTGSWRAATGIWLGAAALSIACSLVPGLRKPLFVGWMCAAFPIGWTVSHLVLAFIFFGVVTPIGLLLRLCGKDPLHRKFDSQATTYWIPHTPPKDKSQYFKQF